MKHTETNVGTPSAPLSLSDWKAQYARVAAIAERVANMRRDRARAACKAAGLDPELLGIHPHNAMVSFNSGKPWREIDYSLVRKTLWLIEQSYLPSRLVTAWDRRVRGIQAPSAGGSR